MDEDTYEERQYYFDNLHSMYRYVDVDSCVQKALFEEYYEEKDDIENDDVDDDVDHDIAGILIVAFLLNVF